MSDQLRAAYEPLEPPRWGVHHPSHMKGWEAFGVTNASPPTVRRLGTGHDGKGKPGTEKWGPGEVVNGVASVQISSYGDHPTGAYIYVVRTAEDNGHRRRRIAADARERIADLLVWAGGR